MKHILFILFLIAINATDACAQLNPTTHLKPGTDTTQILLTRSPNNRLEYRDLYSYLADTLGFGLTIVDSTRLTQDSILIYYNSGSEVGRDTIRTAGGGTTSPAGSDRDIQYNEMGSFGAETDLRYVYSTNTFYADKHGASAAPWFFQEGDTDTYYGFYGTSDNALILAGGDSILFNSNTTPPKFQLGSSVALSLELNSDIYDRNGSSGSSGQILSVHASGGVDWIDPPSGGSPGGSDSYVQYNNGGSFGGESTFTYNDVTNQLTVEDLEVTTGLFDGVNSDGANYELLTSTGTESRWKTISNSITGRYLYIALDGTTIGAGVDLSDANLSDAGTVENNSVAQDLHVSSLTRVTGWATSAEFTGSGINWDSTNDEWDITSAGKYRITVNICLNNTETGVRGLQFWVYVNGSPVGVPCQASVENTYYDHISFSQVLELSSSSSVSVYSARGGGDATTSEIYFCSAVNGGQFTVERINY